MAVLNIKSGQVHSFAFGTINNQQIETSSMSIVGTPKADDAPKQVFSGQLPGFSLTYTLTGDQAAAWRRLTWIHPHQPRFEIHLNDKVKGVFSGYAAWLLSEGRSCFADWYRKVDDEWQFEERTRFKISTQTPDEKQAGE